MNPDDSNQLTQIQCACGTDCAGIFPFLRKYHSFSSLFCQSNAHLFIYFIFFGLQNLCSFAYLLGLMERIISFITSIVQLEFSLLFKEVVVKLLLKHLVCHFTFLGFLCHQFRFSLSYISLPLRRNKQ